ncbi:MAG: hypothetical protein EA380_00050 [Phycisphaeraceae bacterium]|nr:MAG: hypothetical protein EA380_00050 [Phycisphaeraceae bacterium]
MSVQIPENMIETLVGKLTADAPATLSREERSLLATAMYELAHARVVCARQAQLLESMGQDLDEIDRLAHRAVGAASEVSGRDPASGYDADGARRAREELLRRIERAESGEVILEAVLRFVAIGAALAG